MMVRSVEGGEAICIWIEERKGTEQRFEPAELILEEEALPPPKENGD
jgi:hypothetical protein